MTQEEKQLLLKDLCARLPYEEWRIIPDYPEYAVSNKGNVVTLKTGKLRKCSDHKGYKQCMLRKDGKAYNRFVHRLVASAFLHAPQECQVIDHINGIRDDNRVENLRWCSQDENLHFPLAKEHREHLCRICSQYNLDGTYVATYKSSFEAERITGIKSGSIDNCCKTKKLSCGGFQWKYGDSTDNIPPIRKSKRKIGVAKYDEQDNFITAYGSCREAARENNLSFQAISECINGKRKTSYGGFIWKKLIENS
jgi:hypothetical protein